MHKPPAEPVFALPDSGRRGSAGEELPGERGLDSGQSRSARMRRDARAGLAAMVRLEGPRVRGARNLPGQAGSSPAGTAGFSPLLPVSQEACPLHSPSPGFQGACVSLLALPVHPGHRANGKLTTQSGGDRKWSSIPEAVLSSPHACLIGQSPPPRL
ncbi:hypothetical protein P7K49_021253 [Saguinus oedipus]|uniref:Uncharacterized protein n=1 Tax=Saguinus oedipus TaxID=9490 RepID=A0ABQ9US47_SAGOE|nr:hypothetical protein P7K49_021253 [Saguinus oedipus]